MNRTKRILLIADGLADEGCTELQGLTPLAWARHDALDRVASQCCAMTRTIEPHEQAGTERGLPRLLGANPALLGCRAALEASALDVSTEGFTWMARCNLCSLSEEKDAPVSAHDGDGVSESEAHEALEALQRDPLLAELMAPWQGEILKGQGFRHFLGGISPGPSITSGPHDGLITALREEPSSLWHLFTKRASEVLLALPLNKKRQEMHRPLLNGFWPWSDGLVGKKPQETFRSILCVSATPVVRGIALSLGMEAPPIKGATGDVTTDWQNKARVALESNTQAAVIHLEAPDEASHRLSVKDKLAALEIVNQTASFLMASVPPGGLRLMVAIDHGTSVTSGQHLSSPVPWALWDSRLPEGTPRPFVEHQGPCCDVMALWPLLLSDERVEPKPSTELRCPGGS